MPSNVRISRLQVAIKKTLTACLYNRVRDPGLHNVVLNRVALSKDLSNATIFFSFFFIEDDCAFKNKKISKLQVTNTLTSFNKAKGLFSVMLSTNLRLRFIPSLHFQYESLLS